MYAIKLLICNNNKQMEIAIRLQMRLRQRCMKLNTTLGIEDVFNEYMAGRKGGRKEGRKNRKD